MERRRKQVSGIFGRLTSFADVRSFAELLCSAGAFDQVLLALDTTLPTFALYRYAGKLVPSWVALTTILIRLIKQAVRITTKRTNKTN